MRLSRAGEATPLHLSYCTNIHPGESLDEVRRALIQHTVPIARAVQGDAPFGLGLRLSALAAEQLSEPAALNDFAALLRAHNLYVYTLNGFPYGAFHGQRVKEAVYRPDWRSDERVHYTLQLAEILAALLPEGVRGSISTVPGGFREEIASESERARVTSHLVSVAMALHRVWERTGRSIVVSLEPEPHCQLETLAEAIAFFDSHVLSAPSIARVAYQTGLGLGDAEALLRRHLGVCLDVCHAAVEFEDVRSAVVALDAAGIIVGKVQLSNALRVTRVDAAALEVLRAFADPVYLHQVVERTPEGLRRFVDLPDAIASFEKSPRASVEWRVHFHIPLYAEPQGALSSTASVLADACQVLRERCFTDHAEVETYTWDVLPPELREGDVNASVVRELRVTRDLLGGAVGEVPS